MHDVIPPRIVYAGRVEENDKNIIGVGLYGLYSVDFCCRRGEYVLVLECDSMPFRRSTFINQVFMLVTFASYTICYD